MKPSTSLSSSTLAQIETLSSRLAHQAAMKPAGRMMLPVNAIRPGRKQPRTKFPEDSLAELAESIREHGIIEALIVTRSGDQYELVAGERRWRAAQLAGLKEVPAEVREYDDEGKLEDHAFVSNLMREGLSLIDEVKYVARLVARLGSLKDAARKVSKSEAWVSKRRRLAEAPDVLLSFIDSARCEDLDGLYALAVLAEEQPKIAQGIIENYREDGPRLRELVHAAQAEKRAAREARKAKPVPPARPRGERGGTADVPGVHRPTLPSDVPPPASPGEEAMPTPPSMAAPAPPSPEDVPAVAIPITAAAQVEAIVVQAIRIDTGDLVLETANGPARYRLADNCAIAADAAALLGVRAGSSA